jgi:hypothetical protein
MARPCATMPYSVSGSRSVTATSLGLDPMFAGDTSCVVRGFPRRENLPTVSDYKDRR